jgi:ankyrin repeat protein
MPSRRPTGDAPPTPIPDEIGVQFPHLQRVALGGEPIPRRLVQSWARLQDGGHGGRDPSASGGENSFRLLATYGVTEGCVYQTCGEVFQDTVRPSSPSMMGGGQFVGQPLSGMGVRICMEEIQDVLMEVDRPGTPGEVVLYGSQVDEWTGYLNRPDQNHRFVAESVAGAATTAEPAEGSDSCHDHTVYHYRTGDRGVLDPRDGSLTILGRIVGEDGMIKIHGVRVELGEIESALVDEESIGVTVDHRRYQFHPVVVDCLARAVKDNGQCTTIHAYCILSNEILDEIGASAPESMDRGMVISDGPLWAVLRARCSNRLKAACVPSAFIIVRQFPLSPTGKRDRDALPSLDDCTVLSSSTKKSTPLIEYGACGAIVADTLSECLNLQKAQLQMLTTEVSFAMLGGDSLLATLVTRTLYAYHNKVDNTRLLGGQYGQLEEPFNVVNLLRAKNLGEYVDLLDQHRVCTSDGNGKLVPPERPYDKFELVKPPPKVDGQEANNPEMEFLADALLQATTLGQSSIAAALLYAGANPNYGAHGGRIGKTSGRLQQRAIFKSSALHLAAAKGDVGLVKLLLENNANCKSPNTNGLFPIHLAASGLDGEESTDEEASRRLACVKVLLDAGCQLMMRDANKHSVLHAAARAGHVAIIEFVIDHFRATYGPGGGPMSESRYGPLSLLRFMNWTDRWLRTSVHWATLNGRVEALRVLLNRGCDPDIPQPKANKHSSMVTESPLELCDRLYGGTATGAEMRNLLLMAIQQRDENQE